MKKNGLLSLLFILSLNVALSAQTPVPVSKPVKTGNEWHMPADVIPRAQRFTDELTKTLGLDAAASRNVFDTYLANTKAVDEIRMGGGSTKEKEAALQANEVRFEAALKGILSEGQFENYEKMKTDKKGKGFLKPK